MRKFFLTAALLLCSIASFAWDCPTGQIRQQAPTGTSTSTPYYDVVEGIAFICVVTPTAQQQAPSLTNSNSNSNSNSNNNANNNSNSNSNTNNNTNTSTSKSTSASNSIAKQSQQQFQNQNQSQTANGGNATGGTATSNATGGNASAANNGNGSNNTTSNTLVQASKIPVSTAVTPPLMPSAPCVKSMGAGVQTMAFGGSFGAGKIDQGCDDRELARSFSGPQTLASCKILLNTKKAKAAGITLADCMFTPAAIPVEVPIPQVPEVKVPTREPAASVFPEPVHKTTTIACSKFDNICKRQLDEMALRYKSGDGTVSVVYSSRSDSALVDKVGFYLIDQGVGVGNIRYTATGRELEVYVTLVN